MRIPLVMACREDDFGQPARFRWFYSACLRLILRFTASIPPALSRSLLLILTFTAVVIGVPSVPSVRWRARVSRALGPKVYPLSAISSRWTTISRGVEP
jgi:hypothetical protein